MITDWTEFHYKTILLYPIYRFSTYIILMRGTTKFELILFFHAGYKPKELIKMGYSQATVYKYMSHYKKALETFRQKK